MSDDAQVEDRLTFDELSLMLTDRLGAYSDTLARRNQMQLYGKASLVDDCCTVRQGFGHFVLNAIAGQVTDKFQPCDIATDIKPLIWEVFARYSDADHPEPDNSLVPALGILDNRYVTWRDRDGHTVIFDIVDVKFLEQLPCDPVIVTSINMSVLCQCYLRMVTEVKARRKED